MTGGDILANILDYLDWRGDVPFTADPFNEIDGLILSQFCYVPLEGVVSASFSEHISIPDAFRRYKADGIDKKLRILTFEQDNLLFRKLAESRRFRGTMLCGYMSIVEHAEDMPFAPVAAVGRIVPELRQRERIAAEFRQFHPAGRGDLTRFRQFIRSLKYGPHGQCLQGERGFIAEFLQHGKQERAVHSAGKGQSDPRAAFLPQIIFQLRCP